MNAVCYLINTIASLLYYAVLLQVILSLLLAFQVVNLHHPVVRNVAAALDRLVEPMLAPIRRFLPNLGGIDLSPVVFLIALEFVRRLLVEQLCY